MQSTRGPLIKHVHELVGEYGVPEVVEALLAIAQHYKHETKAHGHLEYKGWEGVESALLKCLKVIH